MDKPIVGTVFKNSLMVLGAPQEDAENLENMATCVTYNLWNIPWLIRKFSHQPSKDDVIFCLKEPGGTYLYKVEKSGKKKTTMRAIFKTGSQITLAQAFTYNTKPLEYFFVKIPPSHASLTIDVLVGCERFAEAIGLRGDWRLGFTYPWWETFRVASLVAAFEDNVGKIDLEGDLIK